MGTYEIYCQWCLDTGRKPPTREWWGAACAQPRQQRKLSDIEFDVETERREGWGYGES